MGEAAILAVGQAGVEPPAVFGVDKVAFGTANIGIPGDRPDFRAAITRSSLSRPNADLPPVVKNKASRAAIFEDGVVVLILVKLDASVELGAVLRMSVVSLTSAFQGCLGVLPDASDAAFTVHHPDDPVGRHVDAHGAQGLRRGHEVLLEAVDNKLSGLPVKLGHGLEDGLEKAEFALTTKVVHVIGVHAEEADSAEVPEDGVLGLDGQAGGVIEGHPGLGVVEGVGSGQVLLPLHSPVALLEGLAHLELIKLAKDVNGILNIVVPVGR